MSCITLVVEFDKTVEVPSLGCDSNVLGGKLKKVSFYDELEELRKFETFVRCAHELHISGELDEDEDVDLSEFIGSNGELDSSGLINAIRSLL